MMTDWQVLLIALAMFVVGNLIAYFYKIKWLHFGMAILWFVPIVLVDNVFIRVFSGIMILSSVLIVLSDRKDDFE